MASATFRKALPLTLGAVVLGVMLAGGLFGPRLFGSELEGEVHQRLKEYTDVLDAAGWWSAEPVKTEDLVYSPIEGMIRTLDPHSSFFAPVEYSDVRDKQAGSYYGVGLLVSQRDGRVVVVTPMEGGPAPRLSHGRADRTTPSLRQCGERSPPRRSPLVPATD